MASVYAGSVVLPISCARHISIVPWLAKTTIPRGGIKATLMLLTTLNERGRTERLVTFFRKQLLQLGVQNVQLEESVHGVVTQVDNFFHSLIERVHLHEFDGTILLLAHLVTFFHHVEEECR